MANLFNVNDNVICQKKGGQSGNKPITPAFQGVVKEVLSGGTQYKVAMEFVGLAHTPYIHFKDGIVDEEFMTSA